MDNTTQKRREIIKQTMIIKPSQRIAIIWIQAEHKTTNIQSIINKQSTSIQTTINRFVDLQKNDYVDDKLTT